MTAKERDVRVAVVHGCFSEGRPSPAMKRNNSF